MAETMPIDITAYHEQTKHRFSGLARGPDTLDWDAQPVAFRRFQGAPQIPLPLNAAHHTVSFSALFEATPIAPQPQSLESIALLFELSMAVSAWKQYGTARWALRCNPSSGNLHPTEAYLLPVGIEGLEDGVYHYRADSHALEQRCRLQSTGNNGALFLALTSVHWREAWKYGERAYRYCQLDVGHALAAIRYAAATLGWQVILHDNIGDETLARLLGIDRKGDYPTGSEQEYPDLLVSLHPTGDTASISSKFISALRTEAWFGEANVLDRRHFYHWPIITAVSQATERPEHTPAVSTAETRYPAPLPVKTPQSAAKLMRRRRSAQAFDTKTGMPMEAFFRSLDHLLPREWAPPWDVLNWRPRLHPVLFVHRVDGLEPGLYALPRYPAAKDQLQSELLNDFEWYRTEQAPAHLPLYRLEEGKVEGLAMKLSCGQGIAANGAFSMAMLAEFGAEINETPWRYRELHWEAGLIGQALYLEAEASDLQGTGIGCFFDDGVHDLLGIEGESLQVLYHFTVGKAIFDERISSLPAYDREG